MKITIKKMTLSNFKGIRNLEVNFSDQTSIYGCNASGKTTIKDAFLFLLFGKDSQDRKDYNIKTLDSEGNPIHCLDHSVTAELMLDHRKKVLQRTYREKWIKPRGQAEKEFAGHETVYFADGVPCSQAEYNKEIDAICQEGLFKLLTNPEYFPSQNWTLQRQVLMSMVPEITYEDVVTGLPKDVSVKGIEYLQNALNEGKTLDKIKLQIASEKKNLRDEIAQIPARIDEVTKGMPAELNWDEIENAIKIAKDEITNCDTRLTDTAKHLEEKNAGATKLRKQLFAVKDEIATLENSAHSAFVNYRNDLSTQVRKYEWDKMELQGVIDKTQKQIKAKNLDIESFIVHKEQLLKKYNEIKSEGFVEGPTCSTCGQLLPEEMAANAKQAFETDKAERIASNVRQGKEIAGNILSAKQSIESLNKDIEDYTRRLAELKAPENGHLDEKAFIDEYLEKHGHKELVSKMNELQKEIDNTPQVGADTTAIQNQKRKAQDELTSLSGKLSARSQIDSAKKRLEELHERLSFLNQLLADKERVEYAIQVFSATKMSIVEERVNSKFSLVKFRMFETQINGGIADTCVAMVDGVPYPSLNDAMKVAAGIDIINTLSAYHDISAPIWIDNRESVTSIPETQSQVINLFVSAEDKTLRIQ
jgi:exonuclease SbcC